MPLGLMHAVGTATPQITERHLSETTGANAKHCHAMNRPHLVCRQCHALNRPHPVSRPILSKPAIWISQRAIQRVLVSPRRPPLPPQPAPCRRQARRSQHLRRFQRRLLRRNTTTTTKTARSARRSGAWPRNGSAGPSSTVPTADEASSARCVAASCIRAATT